MKTKKNKKSDLERYRTAFFQIGLISALVIILAAFSLTQEKSNVIIGSRLDTDYIEEMTQVTVQEPPKELKVPMPKQVIEILQIVDNDTDIEDEPDFEDQDVGEDDASSYIPIELDDEVEDEPIFSFADKMPRFPGGDIGLVKYLGKHVNYPNIARENGLEEKIYIRFCVTKLGKVEKVRVLRGTEPILYKEALRVIKSLPKWEPGEKNGEKVSVWYTVPINFKLK
ncbi:MAG: energy transducer TonB [Bacteroidota bacterium]